MSYNRTLDLLAVSLAATMAGLPVKAAKYMQAAAKHESADSAIEAICAANKKKAKPSRRKRLRPRSLPLSSQAWKMTKCPVKRLPLMTLMRLMTQR